MSLKIEDLELESYWLKITCLKCADDDEEQRLYHIIDWKRIVSAAQVKFLRDEYDVFLMEDGRVNMCAFTTSNAQYIADAIAAAVNKAWLTLAIHHWPNNS